MRTIALIAHDNRKVDLVAWATFNRETLARFELVGTRHTAHLIQDKVGLDIEELLSSRPSPTTPMSARYGACATCTTFRSRPISARRT